ncbi:MAG TPA: hypothetical protein DDY43_03770 [Synechococcales bacterium UBA10510]|nr:hypothetical protein [Synechococcales bacterium UBA10510]
MDRFDSGLVMVMVEAIDLAQKEPFPWLDRAGLAALLAGTLILLITFFTSYSHVDIPVHGSIQVNQQIGISLLFAALAALFGEVKLASNSRCAAERDRIEQRIRAAEERERKARQARIQARLAAAQCRFLLADSPLNRLQLSEILALMLEDLRLS